jgi:hypothetical protein
MLAELNMFLNGDLCPPSTEGVAQQSPHLSSTRQLFSLISCLLGRELIVSAVKITNEQHGDGNDWQKLVETFKDYI